MAHPASSYNGNGKDNHQNSLSLFSAADVTEMRRAKKGSLLQKKSFHVFTPLLLLLPYQNNRLFKLGFIFSPCMQLIYHHNLQTLNADN